MWAGLTTGCPPCELQVTFKAVMSDFRLIDMQSNGMALASSLTAEDVTFQNSQAIYTVVFGGFVDVALSRTHFKALTVAQSVLYCFGGGNLQLHEVCCLACPVLLG